MKAIALIVAVPLIVRLAACSAPPPEAWPCLHCSEIITMEQERYLCEESRLTSFVRWHGCRCAPSAPCEAACMLWCHTGDAGPEPGCAECTAAMCPADVAACAAD